MLVAQLQLRGNLQQLWYEYHLIAMNYHWTREEIRKLTKRERQRWVEYIEETLRVMYGGKKGGVE